MADLRARLPDGPLDIVGDVHGELEALLALLHRLGVRPETRQVTRPLVFVGDVLDRGPDSPGVVALVAELVEAGVAWAVAGNHELNLLLGDRKEGNGWFFGDAEDRWQPEHGPPVRFSSRLATEAQRADILRYISSLPLVLEREDLRVVHAAWHAPSVAAIDGVTDLAGFSLAHTQRLREEWKASGLLAAARSERAQFAGLRRRDVEPTRPLPSHVALEVASQSGHPVKALTSGLEREIRFDQRFFVGGRWRLVERSPWWETYANEPAVVIGHYWRTRDGSPTGKPDAIRTAPFDWMGPAGRVFCVDYSVGRRYAERHAGRTRFRHGLAALRWPERVIVFDDREDPVPTGRFGG